MGSLWPFIGIVVEALVLFLIILIAEKRKKDKEKGLTVEWILVIVSQTMELAQEGRCARVKWESPCCLEWLLALYVCKSQSFLLLLFIIGLKDSIETAILFENTVFVKAVMLCCRKLILVHHWYRNKL